MQTKAEGPPVGPFRSLRRRKVARRKSSKNCSKRTVTAQQKAQPLIAACANKGWAYFRVQSGGNGGLYVRVAATIACGYLWVWLLDRGVAPGGNSARTARVERGTVNDVRTRRRISGHSERVIERLCPSIFRLRGAPNPRRFQGPFGVYGRHPVQS